MTPFSPVHSHPGSTHSSSAGSSEAHPLALDRLTSSGSRRSSDVDYTHQLSEMSGSSVEGSLNDPALLKSLNKFKRCVILHGVGKKLAIVMTSLFLCLWQRGSQHPPFLPHFSLSLLVDLLPFFSFLSFKIPFSPSLCMGGGDPLSFAAFLPYLPLAFSSFSASSTSTYVSPSSDPLPPFLSSPHISNKLLCVHVMAVGFTHSLGVFLKRKMTKCFKKTKSY